MQGEEQQEESGRSYFYRIPGHNECDWIFHDGNRQGKGEKACLSNTGEDAFSCEYSGWEHRNLGGDVPVPSQDKALVFRRGDAGNSVPADGGVVSAMCNSLKEKGGSGG